MDSDNRPVVSAQEAIQKELLQVRAAAFAVAAVVCLVLSLVLVSRLPSGSPQTPPADLQTRINPNYAPLGQLVQLPGIGNSRATAIIEYRRTFSEQNDGRPAFRDSADLRNVKGIGNKTIAEIGPWLIFDESQSD